MDDVPPSSEDAESIEWSNVVGRVAPEREPTIVNQTVTINITQNFSVVERQEVPVVERQEDDNKWTLARKITVFGMILVFLGALVPLIIAWMNRPPPPKPPLPPVRKAMSDGRG